MATEEKNNVRIGRDAMSAVKEFAEDKELSLTDAADKLIAIGWGRMRALRKDNNRRAKGLKPSHRKVTVTVIGEKKKKKAKKAVEKAA